MNEYNINHLRELEAESIYVIREVAAQFENPVMLFSGGKDSIIMFHLARKAFAPAKVPFALMHVDTGHNFPETIEFRDRLMEETGTRLIVRYVQDSIDQGKAIEETGFDASRNKLQTVTLLDGLDELQVDCAMGGGRRDEEKARAKERFFLIVMNLENGTQKIKDQNFGIFLMERRTWANTLEFFQFRTGLKWMYGNIFI